MKIKHNTVDLIRNYLLANKLKPSCDEVFVKMIYENVILTRSDKSVLIADTKKSRDARQYLIDSTQRDLLKLKFESNNKSSKGIKEGYVYMITNPAWENFVKIGCAVDVYDRLNSYQTSSPLRDYSLEFYYFTSDRRKEESFIHSLYERHGEWLICDKLEMKKFLKERRNNLKINL